MGYSKRAKIKEELQSIAENEGGRLASLTDVEVFEAVRKSPTRAAAAAALGCSERALYYRLNSRSYRRQAQQIESEIISEICDKARGALDIAIEALTDVASDKEAGAAVRSQAAAEIFKCFERISTWAAKNRPKDNETQEFSDAWESSFIPVGK